MRLSLEKIYPYVIALSMITGDMYLPFMGRLSVAYLLYLLYVCLYMASGKMSRAAAKVNIWFMCALVLITAYDLTNDIDGVEVGRTVIYTGKFIVWILAFVFSIDANFDREKYLNILVNVGLVSTIYLFLQTLAYYVLGIKIDNILKLAFKVVSESSGGVSYYRPSSFFCEPAYYSTFSLCVLAPLMLTDIPCKHRKVTTWTLILGIILSGSTAGIVLLASIIILYEIRSFQHGKKGFSTKEVAALFVGLIAIFIYFNYETILPMFGQIGRMLLVSIRKMQRLQRSARVGGSFAYLNNVEQADLLFGAGIGNEYALLGGSAYLNSITRIILQTGYVGVVLFSVYIMQFLVKSKNLCSLFFVLMFIAKSVTGNAAFSIAGLFMMLMYKIFNESQ